MIMFRDKSDIYDWFQQIQGWNRMDFLCNLITLCNPFELRFIGACIEDKAQTDYNTLRDQEIKANGIENLEQFMSKCPPVDEFRSHISVCLTLLQSSNYKVASKLATVMEEKLDDLNLEHLMEAGLDAEVEQWMLMLTLAAYHPAFSFEKRFKFKRQLSEYGMINKKERKTFPQSTWCTRPHLCSQPTNSTADCEDTEWTPEMNPDSVPFQSYSIYPEHGYGYADYSSVAYQGNPIHANVPDRFTRLQTMRPSTFPSPLTPLGNRDAISYGVNYPQTIDAQGCHLNSPRDGRTNRYNGALPTLPSSTQDFNSIASNPSTIECISPQNSALQQPTVSRPHACSNVTSVLSTVLTTTVVTKTTSHSKPSKGEHLSWGSGYTVSNNKSRQYISNPNATNPVQASKRTHYETQSQRSKNRNRSQSGDTSLGTQIWKKSHENAPDPDPLLHQLRISTSAPMLAVTKEEQTKSSTDFKTEKQHEKTQNLRNKNASPFLTTKDLKPLKVSVNIIPKSKRENPKPRGGTCFNLKVDWSDRTTSQCDHSVDEMVQFYKQITGRIGKKAISIDFLAKQNNQIMERREKLEEIFSEIVASTVTDSNLKQFMTFLNHKPNETPAPSSLPLKKRKFRTGSKSRAVVDENSSSSSTASPPLVNSKSNSSLVSPPNSRPESSLSPLSNKGSASGSSVLSSPTSAKNAPTTNEDPNHDNSTRNDPYLKLYYWLKERNLMETYTHFKKYRYDEFFKLRPSDINKFEFLSNEQKVILNKEMAKMRNEEWNADEEDTTLGIDMGMLSLSSSLQTEENKTKDIKSILEDVARTASEDEKSGSNRSAPVEMPNTDDIEAIASNSCFSFEFDSSSATVDSSAHSKRNDRICKNDTNLDIHEDNLGTEGIEYYHASSRLLNDPQRAWSQSDIRPPGYPYSTVYLQRSAPPLPQMAYFARPFSGDQMAGNPMMMGCYIPSQSTVTYHPPVSSSSTVTMPQHPTITQAPIVTGTSAVGQKQPQYSYNVGSTAQPRPMYPLPGPFRPAHSITSPMGDGMPIAPILYDVTPEFENSSSTVSTNLEFSERVSPESSDPDLSLKATDGPTAQSASDNAVNKNSPAHTNYFYNPAPRFHYNVAPQPQWVQPMHHHSLAPTFSDPSSFIPKKQVDFGDHSAPIASGRSFNGYFEIRNSFSVPSMDNNRTVPHGSHYSGDATKKMNALSCCNCGRKGHDASTCRDPNAVEVLGKDFHLKMSQSSQGR